MHRNCYLIPSRLWSSLHDWFLLEEKKKPFFKKPQKNSLFTSVVTFEAASWQLVSNLVNRIRKDVAKKGVAKLIMVFLQS